MPTSAGATVSTAPAVCPTLTQLPLASNVSLGGFSLRFERVEFLVESFLGRLPRVDSRNAAGRELSEGLGKMALPKSVTFTGKTTQEKTRNAILFGDPNE